MVIFFFCLQFVCWWLRPNIFQIIRAANLPIIPRTISRKGQTEWERHQENVKKNRPPSRRRLDAILMPVPPKLPEY
jgi:hypothetical protein